MVSGLFHLNITVLAGHATRGEGLTKVGGFQAERVDQRVGTFIVSLHDFGGGSPLSTQQASLYIALTIFNMKNHVATMLS